MNGRANSIFCSYTPFIISMINHHCSKGLTLLILTNIHAYLSDNGSGVDKIEDNLSVDSMMSAESGNASSSSGVGNMLARFATSAVRRSNHRQINS